jgi:hypothetical protein
MTVLSRLLLPSLFVTFAWSCGGARIVEKPAPAPVVEAASADPLGTFRGDRFQPGKRFRLVQNPVGIPERGLILRLANADWTSYTRPDGVEVRRGSAVIEIRQGENERRLRIDTGEHRAVFGAKVHLHDVGETYVETAMEQMAFAEVTVE